MLENIVDASLSRRRFLKLVAASSVFGCRGNGKRIFNATSEGPFNIFDYFPLSKGSKWKYTDWENEVITFHEGEDRKEITYGSRRSANRTETYFIKGDELFLHSEGVSSYFEPDVLVGNSSVNLGDSFATNFDLYIQGGDIFSGNISFRKHGTGVITWAYSSLEDVEVPVGIFRNCLRVEKVNKESLWRGVFQGASEDTYWLAKGVGRVKHISLSLGRHFDLVDYEIR